MTSYAVDPCFKYSYDLYPSRASLLFLFISILPGCTPTAMSESYPALRLLGAELGTSPTQINQILIRHHRRSMKCSSDCAQKNQNCVFKGMQGFPLTLAGRLLTEIHYHFTDNQLTQITGHFAPQSGSEGYQEKMRQRYGAPSESTSQQLH